MCSHLKVLLTAALVTLASIQPAVAAPNKAKKAAFSAEVNGQVFIVTKGQQAIKLALVPVAVLSEHEVEQRISSRNEVVNRRRAAIAPQLRDVEAEFRKIVGEKTAQYDELLVVSKKALECLRSTASSSSYMTCTRRPDMEAARARATELANELRPILDELKASKVRERRATLSEQFEAGTAVTDLFENFADVASAPGAKTDPDGKFQIVVKTPGRNALLATSSRSLGEKDEQYRWLVWLPPTKSGEKVTVTLANDNLIGTACSDCVNLRKGLDLHPEVVESATSAQAN